MRGFCFEKCRGDRQPAYIFIEILGIRRTGDRQPAYTFIEPLGIRQTGDRPPAYIFIETLGIRRTGDRPACRGQGTVAPTGGVFVGATVLGRPFPHSDPFARYRQPQRANVPIILPYGIAKIAITKKSQKKLAYPKKI